jgi:hypothetical protein
MVLERGAQADARGAQVPGRGAQDFACGTARCALQVLDRCARPLSAAPLVVRFRYLIVAPRPLPAVPLVVHRRYLIVVPRPMPAAPRHFRSKRRTTRQNYSGAE